jgi:hypothetical protein
MSTLHTILGSEVIANSRTDINTNFSNLNTDKIETSYLDTDTTLAANSDTKIATQKAVKAYADAVSSPTGKSWNNYVADAGATDTYAITLTGYAAYTTGDTFKFKAGTANTGACSLNVNGLGAKTIKKDVSSDLATGDILANQIVTVIYDGTNMQLVSVISGTATTTAVTAQVLPLVTAKQYTVGALDNALAKLWFNIQLPFITWTGAVVNDTTTTFENWVRNVTSGVIEIQPMGTMARFLSTGGAMLLLRLNFIMTGTTPLGFGTAGKTFILDWWAKLPASGSTGDITMGFSGQDGFMRTYTDSAYYQAIFCQRGSTGVLYAKTANGDAYTNVDVSASLTQTNWNNFRIEVINGTNVKFYINGVLVATTTTNCPSNTDVQIGFGRSDTSLFLVTAPNFSVKLV